MGQTTRHRRVGTHRATGFRRDGFVRGGVAVLTTRLQDNYHWVRDNAARSLAKLGTLAEPAIPTLVAPIGRREPICPFPRRFGIEAD